jgi:hypothetical protein
MVIPRACRGVLPVAVLQSQVCIEFESVCTFVFGMMVILRACRGVLPVAVRAWTEVGA